MHPWDCKPDCAICHYWAAEAALYGPIIAAAFDRQFGTDNQREDEMSFTAEEYRTAAKVAQALGCEAFAQDLEGLADRLDRREQYAIDLAVGGGGGPFVAVGTRIIAKLLEDGWTAPEGLL